MNFRKTLLTISITVLSTSILAATYVAPSNRVRIWEGSAVSFPDSQYSIGTTTAMGTVKTLKSNATVTNLLTTLNIASNAGSLDLIRAPGAILSGVTFNGSSHQRLSDAGIPSGQCVAFARSMTGAPTSPSWYRGKSLNDYVSWNGVGYYLNNNQWNPALKPGTMIAHFQGLAKYPQSQPYGHVAIFMSWSYNSQGYIDGINVVDENLISLIAGNTGSAAGLIQKHKLTWSCTAGSSCGTSTYDVRFFGSNYHVVDVH